ncbi:C-Maf-inducing protein-like [Argiope bruennichi]|nr:C-Maf-inducing protein-like [Argiope bruennichi]
MASNGEVTSLSLTNFKWLTRKSHSHVASSSSSERPKSECLPKSNVTLPGFHNNFISGDRNGERCIVLRNDIGRSISSESEDSSCTSRQNSIDSSLSSSSSSTDGMSAHDLLERLNIGSRSVPSSPSGPKYKLIHEGDIQVCRLNHSRTVISKILSSKFLRRWESHHLYLNPTQMHSKTPCGFMEEAVQYALIEDVYILVTCETTQKYCVCVDLPDGSLLLQVNNAYVRDQWLHSIIWKRNMLKYRKLLSNTRRSDVFLKELKSLVEMTLTTPLQNDSIYNSPLELISELLQENLVWLPKSHHEEIISVICPILELTTPTPEVCDFLTKYCRENPRSRIVLELFIPIVQRILKHNMDFGKFPKTRVFVQEYIQALSYQNDGKAVLEKFINSIHGVSSGCPHPRVLPNLVSVCLAAVYALYEEKRNWSVDDRNDASVLASDWENRLVSFVSMLEFISAHEDWLPGLSQLLQPIPFPDDALADSLFTKNLKPVLERICKDERCDVHLMVMGVRDEKEGWLHLYCPGGIACDDEGELWSTMLKHLLECCCRRKKFLENLTKSIGPCMLRALRGDATLQSVLCSMLELEVIDNKDLQVQMITTLQSTPSGKQLYASLCQRQQHLRELQQKGGPRKLTLPSRSTDSDVAKLLSCGSFGNLECLSLAFTQVTSSCAEQLIKLPSLRYLNLWSTQFGDGGLLLISEHLPKLQTLNLCETPVSDKGLQCLASMKSLRKLNLNSTSLTAQTFEKLKQSLPALQECDIRYTDAW